MEETIFRKGGVSLLSRVLYLLFLCTFMSFFSMPIHISHRLDNLQRDFFEGMRDAKKYH